MLQPKDLLIPDPTPEQVAESYIWIEQQQDAYLEKHSNKHWRQPYLEMFPQMDNAKGIAKLNNFLHQKRFNADIYRSLQLFFNKKNDEHPCN